MRRPEKVDRVFVLRGYGDHPLIRGLPRREKLIEMNQQVNSNYRFVQVRGICFPDPTHACAKVLADQSIHKVVLAFLAKVLSSARSPEDFKSRLCDEQKEVIKACVVFLFYFLYDHHNNSMLLSNARDLGIITKLFEIWPGTSVVTLLNEILVDNGRANKMLDETQIKGFVNLLFTAVRKSHAEDLAHKREPSKFPPSDWSRGWALIVLLESIVENEKVTKLTKACRNFRPFNLPLSWAILFRAPFASAKHWYHRCWRSISKF